ncbi:patatin-like phospholipase family protein [Geothrix sp. 21YS21S-4]|uniref:patatin-like phospholipase family protein n=1 Tax=Geothrix sp. 21YS21S-4 TaxID=3068889 RepID=UPI0027BA8C9A|nr:patatin-like phospholipase family protein [Geothrix sp. 21YS21S-4]
MRPDPPLLKGHGAEYPEEFAREEGERIAVRRRAVRKELGDAAAGPADARPVGLALSGGGIRSATFCLGVLRGLARHGVLPRVDLLSTVSGGGYIGSFLGALIHREGLKAATDCLEQDPPPLAGSAPVLASPVRWLRENGRYLAPSGSGDLLLMMAILFRNWVAVHVVLGTLLLSVMLLLKGVWALSLPASWLAWTVAPAAGLWWSPWIAGAGVLFLTLVVPPGWAYWLVEAVGEDYSSRWFSPVWAAAASVALFGGLGLAGLHVPWIAATTCSIRGVSWVAWVCFGFALEGLQALIWFVVLAWGPEGEWGARRGEAFDPLPGKRAACLRWRLSRLLSAGIIATLAMALLALADSLGQSVYAVLREKGASGLALWAAGLSSVTAFLAAWGPKLAAVLPKRREDVHLPVSLLAGAAAVLLIGVLFVGQAAFATGLAWGFRPVAIPAEEGGLRPVGAALTKPPAKAEKPTAPVSPPKTPPAPFAPGVWLGSFALCAGLTLFAFGRNRAFLNLSAMGAFYQKRLSRTYLGASNPRRQEKGTSPRDEAPGDDFRFETYRLWEKGGPLHFINVTINETLDGATGIQNQDRKGTPLAVGPLGVSVGVSHHAQWTDPARRQLLPESLEGAGRWPVFFASPGKALEPQPLTLGQWMGISGAAFSTGMGSRTSFGLSFLCGFFNVRTGYWWYSGMDPEARPTKVTSQAGGWYHFSRALPVQAHLLDEWMARFRGTLQRYWYLSDGGHFENTAVYELARRRIPYLILCDAGADPDYAFDDLANLTLKLRNDFGAELRFLDGADLAAAWKTFRAGVGLEEGGLCPALGPVESLRRGDWEVKGQGVDPTLVKAALEGRSRAHAALARIDYPCCTGEGPEHSLLLVLKPTLTGDEPMDVRFYHERQPAFPHEPTLDQFFDEAQWEAYRRLGEHTVDAAFECSKPVRPTVGGTSA